jgi:surface protein
MMIGLALEVGGGRAVGGAVVEANFIFTVRTTTANETFTIPCKASTVPFDSVVDWGDGSTSAITAFDDVNLAHSYVASGDHQIKISGTFPNMSFNNGGDDTKVISVENLGVVGWEDLSRAWRGCSNMVSWVAGDTDTSNVIDMERMFDGCVSLTTLDLVGLSTGNVSSMNFMFNNLRILPVLDVSNFDTTKVVEIGGMFRDCREVQTLDVSNWVVNAVSRPEVAFQNCLNLLALDTSSWVMPLCARADSMFHNCVNLSGTLDVTGFDTTNASRMDTMFASCGSLTDIIGAETFSLAGISGASSMANFMSGVTLPTARYDAVLTAFSSQDPLDGLATDFGSSKYTGGGAADAARATLVSRDGWTIADGGPA